MTLDTFWSIRLELKWLTNFSVIYLFDGERCGPGPVAAGVQAEQLLMRTLMRAVRHSHCYIIKFPVFYSVQVIIQS